METQEEVTAALDTLQRSNPEELAAFIVSLLYGVPPGVRSNVEAFITAAGGGLSLLARRLCRTSHALVNMIFIARQGTPLDIERGHHVSVDPHRTLHVPEQ